MKGKVLSRKRRTDSGSRAKRRKVCFLTRRKREIGGRVRLEGRRGAELRSPLRSGSELFHWGGSISIVSDR